MYGDTKDGIADESWPANPPKLGEERGKAEETIRNAGAIVIRAGNVTFNVTVN